MIDNITKMDLVFSSFDKTYKAVDKVVGKTVASMSKLQKITDRFSRGFEIASPRNPGN